MMLNSRNNAFYGIFMPLHHCLGFPNMILEGGSFDPHDPPGSAPVCNIVYCDQSESDRVGDVYCVNYDNVSEVL